MVDDIRVLILGAGYGTRLQRDLEQSAEYRHLLGKPKALLPLGGCSALLDHWVQQLEHKIPRHAIHVVCNDANHAPFVAWADQWQIPKENILNDGSKTNEDRLGAVADMDLAIRHFGLDRGHVLVIGGDTLMLPGFDMDAFFKSFDHQHQCLVTTYKVPDHAVSKVGIIELDQQGGIINFVEKPSPDDTPSRQACPCFYLFHRESLAILSDYVRQCHDNQASRDALDATGRFLAHLFARFPIQTVPIQGRIDVGSLATYLEADRLLSSP